MQSHRSESDALEQATRARQRAEARAEAAELDLERAHHLLDDYGVPREVRAPGQRDVVELSLLGRMQLFFEEDED